MPGSGGRRPQLDLDVINITTWGGGRARQELSRLQGTTDPGERRAIELLADHLGSGPLDRGPVLDLGIGTGRTVELVAPLTDRYVGIDYTPAMVEAARSAHPGMDIRWGDARVLTDVGDEEFAAVMFSFNGIDAVDNAGRAQVLQEAHRVLAPGGVLLYSTHNLQGPGAKERPWHVQRAELAHPRHLARRAARFPAEMLHRHRRLAACQEGEGWAMRVAGAHGFGIVIRYATLSDVYREVADAGFAVPTVLSSTDARELPEGSDTADTWWFQVLATKA